MSATPDDEHEPIERLYRRFAGSAESADPATQRALAGFVATAAQRGDAGWLDRSLAPRPDRPAGFRLYLYAKDDARPSMVDAPGAGSAVRNALFALEHDDQRSIESIEVVSDDGRGLQRCVLLASHTEGARVLPPQRVNFLGEPDEVASAVLAWRTTAEVPPEPAAPEPIAPAAYNERVLDDEQPGLRRELDLLRRRVADAERARDLEAARHQASVNRLADRLDSRQARLERQLRKAASPSPEVLGALAALGDRLDDLSEAVRRSTRATASPELLGKPRGGSHRPAPARRVARRPVAGPAAS